MDVNFSGWLSDPPRRFGRRYTYSKMAGARDTTLEAWFDIQAGCTFAVSELDLTEETPVRLTLRPLDGSGTEAVIRMIGKPDGRRGAVFGSADRDGVERCLKAFFEGKGMHFGVDTTRGEKLMRLPLPNDSGFQAAYKSIYDQADAANDDFSDIAGDVRNNPKGYALWLVEQNPGEHIVMLVKLDREGQATDTWHIGGTFQTRQEQGAVALEIARDLRISVFDVVPNEGYKAKQTGGKTEVETATSPQKEDEKYPTVECGLWQVKRDVLSPGGYGGDRPGDELSR